MVRRFEPRSSRRVAHVVEVDEKADPVTVVLFSAGTVLAHANRSSDLVEQARRGLCRRRSGHG